MAATGIGLHTGTRVRLVLCGLVAALVGGCAGTPTEAVPTYLDPRSGLTIRTVATPLVFAREAPELAAYERDYVSVGAVEVDEMGRRIEYLQLCLWSTIDRARSGTPAPALPGAVRAVVEGRPREFAPLTHEPGTLGIGIPLLRPRSGYLGETWYRVSAEDLRALARQPPASIEVDTEAGTVRYGAWPGTTQAFAEFVATLPEPREPERPRR